MAYVVYSIILFSVLYYCYIYYYKPNCKGRGFCNENDPYIEPVVHNNFISQDEKEYLIDLAEPQFNQSIVLTGSDVKVRESETAWISTEDPVAQKIIQRVCDLTNSSCENAEKIQIVKYQPGGFYKEHHDSSCYDRPECVEFEKNGGQRKFTMLISLSDQFEGGATRFPLLNRDYKLSICDGLLFHCLERDGNKGHPKALHAGMPVISGQKYIANVWLREHKYNHDGVTK